MDKPDLSAMTTNERLFELGTLEKFDTARARHDLPAMRRLLKAANVDEPSIEIILSRAVSAQ